METNFNVANQCPQSSPQLPFFWGEWMKHDNLQELKKHIGKKVEVLQRHVTQISNVEGTLVQILENGIEVREHEEHETKYGLRDSGLRYINKSHLISVKLETGEYIR